MSRYTCWFILLCALLALLMLASLINGAVTLSLEQLFSVLNMHSRSVPEMLRRIVIDIRLPRVLLTVLTGAGLAVVGALLQTTTRNDLADPFLFGLSSGASVGAVLIITRFGDLTGAMTLPLAAFSGGVISALAVISLFHFKRERGAESLILCGLACSFLFGALTSYLIFSGDQRASSSVLFWSLGGLGLARWDNLIFALLSGASLLIFAAARCRQLDGLLAGDRTAYSLGINVKRLRTEAFFCCAFATALLVALTGVIGFVGLMVPHLCRRIAGVKHAQLLPLCAVTGAVLLCGGDILSRTLLAPQELPVGIITAAIGGIFILGMMARR